MVLLFTNHLNSSKIFYTLKNLLICFFFFSCRPVLEDLASKESVWEALPPALIEEPPSMFLLSWGNYSSQKLERAQS